MNQRAEMTASVGVPEERRDNVANRRGQFGTDRYNGTLNVKLRILQLKLRLRILNRLQIGLGGSLSELYIKDHKGFAHLSLMRSGNSLYCEIASPKSSEKNPSPYRCFVPYRELLHGGMISVSFDQRPRTFRPTVPSPRSKGPVRDWSLGRWMGWLKIAY